MTVVMDVEINPDPPVPPEEEADMAEDTERDDIISFLTHNETVFFKSQQKWEADLTTKEKSDIALNIFESSKLNFLMRFGKYLKREHLKYFDKFISICEPDGSEIDLILKDLHRNASGHAHTVDVKNRRYAALLRMVEEDSYFSEIEMMKRNPLLYEQLVGQYLSIEEKKERDKYKMEEGVTFVKILMEGIERDNAEVVRKNQEETEDSQMEEEDTSDEEIEDDRSSSPEPCYSRWGEIEESKPRRHRKVTAPTITAQERLILKEEFITTMYQNFLDGKDDDFNYDSVDNDTAYDNITEIEHDEEDKYFAEDDSNEADIKDQVESSEDELDIYMGALNQHPAVCQLSQDLKRL